MARILKKGLAVVLALMLMLAVVGCNATPSEDQGTTTSSSESTTTTAGTSSIAPPSSHAPSKTQSTVKPTTHSTTKKTTQSTTTVKPTTQSTAKPTTQSTAKPTVKPTTATTKSTTKSTTKPTTQSTTKSTTESTTTTTTMTTMRDPLPSDYKNEHDIGFGYYCVTFDKYGFDTKWRDLAKTDYINTFFCDTTKYLEELKDYNCKVWYGVQGIYEKVRANSAGWQDEFDELYQEIKDTGCEDTVLGWYLDEPSHMDAIKTLTKYAKEAYGKRFFICFMVQTTDATVDNNYIDANRHINADAVQYLTDIGMDYYADPDQNKARFDKLFNKLHQCKAPNAKMWFIPRTFTNREYANSGNTQGQVNLCIKQLNYMYDKLKAEPANQRGGIMCFAYDFDPPNEPLYGIYQLRERNSAWQTVMNRVEQIGREICCG